MQPCKYTSVVLHYGKLILAQNGPGATSFGGALDPNPPLSNDAQHNILAAIVRWVEEGIAPDNFTAAHYTNGNVSEGVDFTRPICKASP